MEIFDLSSLKTKVSKVKKDEMYIDICKTIKKLRKERYSEFKKKFGTKKDPNNINPYSTEQIAKLLDYNHTHYKRFESSNDKTKQIPLEKIIKLALIFDVSLEDIIKL